MSCKPEWITLSKCLTSGEQNRCVRQKFGYIFHNGIFYLIIIQLLQVLPQLIILMWKVLNLVGTGLSKPLGIRNVKMFFWLEAWSNPNEYKFCFHNYFCEAVVINFNNMSYRLNYLGPYLDSFYIASKCRQLIRLPHFIRPNLLSLE